MKKILPILAVLLLGIGYLRAATPIYRAGNQFPATCGSASQTLSANGDCTTSWVAAGSSPTSLLSSTNTWSAQQNFGTITTSSATLSNVLYTDYINVSADKYIQFTGTGGTGNIGVEPGFNSLDIRGFQYLTLTSDAGHLSMGAGIDSGIRRRGAASIGVTNGQGGVGALSTHHLSGDGTAPTLDACGGGSPSVVGSDIAATITVGSAAGACGLLFNTAWTNAPICNISERTPSLVNALSYTVTITSVTVTQTALSGSILDVICIGRD